jgi:inosine-uridine nucleoside N-ribohydrolase
MNRIPVILDTDIGTDIDDTWALAMLLNCPELDLRLVTTVSGDTTYRAHLAAKFLQTAGREDIPIGIGLGDGVGSLNFQARWLDGLDISSYSGQIRRDGVWNMLDVIDEAEQPVTLISIGVATNIARALEIEPNLASKCRFVGMFGSICYGYDGASRSVAEANVRYDVPAFRKVLGAHWLEKIITPLDTCGRVTLDGTRYQQVYRSGSPMLKALIENYKIWAEGVSWMEVDYVQVRSSTLFDTVAVYLAYGSDLLDIEQIRLRITDDGLTYPDPAGDEVQVALRWRDLEGFLDHLLERLRP